MAVEPLKPDCAGDPIGCLLRKLRVRDEVSAREEEVLRSAIEHFETFRAGKTIIRTGALLNRSMLLIEGLVARYKDLSDGQRQIMEIHVPGDFTDLHGFPLKMLDHDIGSISEVTAGFVPHERLQRITEEEPHLTRLLWMSTLMDAAIQRERILSVGRRPAMGRIAHLMCELHVRFDAVGMTEGMTFPFPFTQMDLGDSTGLTSVHVNRMLRELREQGLLTFRGGRVTIHDWERLQAAAEFDPVYLHLDRRPR
ncbi:MAG TPA: Crp/Fnr family transcriptional regulator [Allosphingosinicella sp.]|nr:Crp/Fnr family transcriptional regulator [Allosphingosinicella sp.]